MSTLESLLADLAHSPAENKPRFFNLTHEADRASLSTLIENGSVKHISDDFKEQQLELFGIKNPSKVYAPGFKEAFGEHWATLEQGAPIERQGLWVYFPWSSTISHILPEEEYWLVRTARNQNLIAKEEQEKYYKATIGIAGLSVGSSVAFAIVLSGGAKRMKLADMDRLALTNTNRILAGADRLGMLKVEMAARTIYEINPYAELELYTDGLTKDNIQDFFDGLDVVIDEIDNLALKYLIREQASKRKIPIVMAADNGDNALVEIERHDRDPQPAFFHGRMGEVSYALLNGLDKFSIGRLITKWVGAETVTNRMQESLKEMGKTIVSWPQLGVAALINGAAVAYCVRKVLTGEPLIDDRALISLDENLVPGYNDPEQVRERQEKAKAFAASFGL